MLVLSTSLGDIRIALLDQTAPATTQHIRSLIASHALGPGCFYRAQRLEHVVPGREFEVLQGGWPRIAHTLPSVEHEPTVPHTLGTVSLARLAPGTASSEMFLCLSDKAPALDAGAPPPMDGHGFAVFGQVVAGLDIAQALHAQPTSDEEGSALLRGQMLRDSVPFDAQLVSPGHC